MSAPALIASMMIIVSCRLPEQAGDRDKLELGWTSRYNFGDLQIQPTVDTTDAFNAEAIACLRRFCQNKLDTTKGNDYWLPSDLERFGGIHAELYYAEFDSLGEPRYPPTLLAITKTEVPDERLLTVNWAKVDKNGNAERVRYAFDFLAVRVPEGVRLGVPLDHRTRTWERKILGPITFVVSPQRHFAAAQANEQVKDVERLARFFEMPVFPITFYSCIDPAELFHIRGYQQHPMMHAFPTGGRAEGKNIVFSGNNKERYTHEIVHLFTGSKFQERPWVLDEGLATLLAGSAEYPFTWHRANLKEFLGSGAEFDLEAVLGSYEPFTIEEHTNVAYAIGGVLCERILRAQGKRGLFTLLSSGEKDLFVALSHFGVSKGHLREIILSELELDPVQLDW